MSYTFTADVGDGVKTIFPFSFAGQDTGYLRVTDITVYVAGVSVPFTINLTDPNKVYLTTAPAIGAEVLIRRIMPKNVPYSDFARGNPFSQDTLNNTNLQQLYVVQELLDGFLPEGFYFKQDVNMGGHKLTDLGEGTQAGESIRYEQWKNHDDRLLSLEDSIIDETQLRTIPWPYVAVGGEVTLSPPYEFISTLLYINGIFQNKNLGAFTINPNSTITLPEPLVAGDEVYLLIGSGPAAPDDYVTQGDLTGAINGAINDANDYTDTQLLGKANKGANSDITSLAGLTTPLSLTQGGLGSSTAAGGRATLGLGGSATLNVGTTVGTVAAGDDSRILGAAQKASNLADLTSASAARGNLGLGNSATLNTGSTAGTVLAGNATGRLIGVQRFSASGTYTPVTGMTQCIVEVVGGGGAGGGVPATGVAQGGAGAGGNSGCFARVLLTSATIGASQAITIGAGGVAVTGAAGGNGLASSVGDIVVCGGGNGGTTTGAVATIAGGAFALPAARVGPAIATGTVLAQKQTASGLNGIVTTTASLGGTGADSNLGNGGPHSSNAAGVGASSFGGGGGGASSGASVAARAGGAGGAGLVLVYEYT